MRNEINVIFCFAVNEVKLEGSHGKRLSWTAEEGCKIVYFSVVKNESCLTDNISVQLISYGLDCRGVGGSNQVSAELCLLTIASRHALDFTQFPIWWVPGDCFRRGKAAGV
jgi:hypothetical protein